MLTAIGVEAFAERARHELVATAGTVRERGVDMAAELTAEEAHVGLLAGAGFSNQEIGARLLVTPAPLYLVLPSD
jgi:hypothetical protein